MSKERERFIAARVVLIRRFVFFGAIAMQLELIEDSTFSHAAATDGKRLIFNPTLTEEFSFGELVAVIIHEVLHVVFLHHLRRKTREPEKWNVACDYAINLVIVGQLPKAKSKSDPVLPSGALIDFKYKEMSAEQIYDKLPDGMSDSGFGAVLDATKDKSESEVSSMEAMAKSMIQNAAAIAKKAGQFSDKLARIVEAICEPKASWRYIIQDYLTERAEVDYNWAKPHQRMLSQYGIIYPTLDGEKIGKLVILVDASGSCYKEQEQFCSEVSDILSSYECSIDVVYHDAKVTKVDHYESSDLPIVMRPAGFGGTDCKAAYDCASEFDPELIIHLTDLELDWRNVETPNCDVVVACSHKAMFSNCPKWAKLIDIS